MKVLVMGAGGFIVQKSEAIRELIELAPVNAYLAVSAVRI